MHTPGKQRSMENENKIIVGRKKKQERGYSRHYWKKFYTHFE